MYAASSNRGETGISRRSFVQLTVGSIVMLPTVTNALLLPSREALADEGDAAARTSWAWSCATSRAQAMPPTSFPGRM